MKNFIIKHFYLKNNYYFKYFSLFNYLRHLNCLIYFIQYCMQNQIKVLISKFTRLCLGFLKQIYKYFKEFINFFFNNRLFVL